MDRSVDISKPKWGEESFQARFNHFVKLTDPRNCLKTNVQLEEAKQIVQTFKSDGVLPKGGSGMLWDAKYVYDSAFHPETGEKQNLMGRMSFQVPGGMVLTGLLLAFYKKPLEIFLAQWLTQSFNAMVNYTNRSGDKPLPKNVILSAYVTATSLATATSIGLNKLASSRAPPLIGRFVPYVAVAVANMVNIPCMRSQEMIDGVVVVDADGNKLGNSVICAKKSIASVTFSRCCMATPMLITPVIMQWLEKKPFMKGAGKVKSCVMQTLIAGLFMLPAIPAGCALFTQQQSISVDKLEDDLRTKISERDSSLKTVYYNKGL